MSRVRRIPRDYPFRPVPYEFNEFSPNDNWKEPTTPFPRVPRDLGFEMGSLTIYKPEVSV